MRIGTEYIDGDIVGELITITLKLLNIEYIRQYDYMELYFNHRREFVPAVTVFQITALS